MSDSIAILNYFNSIPDPRVSGMIMYPLEEILLVLLCGTLCGMPDIDDIEFWANENLEFFQRYMSYKNRIAPAQTIRRVLASINSICFITSLHYFV